MDVNTNYQIIDVIGKLAKWSEKKINFGKYECLHTGHGNMD